MNKPIARYNEEITFQRGSVNVDAYRNRRMAWVDYFTCYGYAGTLVGTKDAQESRDATATERRRITFEVRYCPELGAVTSKDFRVVFRGEPYDILSVDMMNYQNRELHFLCAREVRDG